MTISPGRALHGLSLWATFAIKEPTGDSFAPSRRGILAVAVFQQPRRTCNHCASNLQRLPLWLPCDSQRVCVHSRMPFVILLVCLFLALSCSLILARCVDLLGSWWQKPTYVIRVFILKSVMSNPAEDRHSCGPSLTYVIISITVKVYNWSLHSQQNCLELPRGSRPVQSTSDQWRVGWKRNEN